MITYPDRLVVRCQSLLAVGALFICLLWVASASRADLLFSESFDYPEGPLVGDGPPPGSPPDQSAWMLSVTSPTVIATGLRHNGVFSTGGAAEVFSAFNNGNSAFAMSTPVNSGVVWLGFLIEGVDGRAFGYAGIALLTPDGSPPLGVGLNYAYIYYGLDNDTGQEGGEALTDVKPGKGTVDWLVARLDFNAGTETLYVNPVKNSEGTFSAEGTAQLRMIPSFQAAGFNQVLVHDGYVQGNFVIDEVRIGDTFNEIRAGR